MTLLDLLRTLAAEGIVIPLLQLGLPDAFVRGGGALLALHFAFWISSLDYTSVMSSVVFVSTNPVFVALASFLLLKERVNGTVLAGIAVAVAGGVIVGAIDIGPLRRSRYSRPIRALPHRLADKVLSVSALLIL